MLCLLLLGPGPIFAQSFVQTFNGDVRIIGRLDVDDTRANAFVGREVGTLNTHGFYNTAVGHQSFYKNKYGQYNAALGYKALYSNFTGYYNTAIGNAALYYNVVGSGNTAVGTYALAYNESGDNTAMGYQASYNNKSGNSNTALGTAALYSNESGSYNTAVGYRAMYASTEDGYNTAVGAYALSDNTTGYNNTALGYMSLTQNVNGNFNIGLGHLSLRHNTSGSANIGIGRSALVDNLTGWNNIAIGDFTLSENTQGSGNTFIGNNCGLGITSGQDNTAVGNSAYNAGNYSNSGAFGAGAYITASNQYRLGNAYVTTIGGAVSWSNLSDKRFKKQIRSDVPGLDFIRKLEPVTYQLDRDAIAAWQGINKEDGPQKKGAGAKTPRQTGFLAQDVEAVAREIGYEFSGVDAPKSEGDRYGLRYAEFVVPLVKAVQELEAENETLKAQQVSLMEEMAELKTLVQRLQQQSEDDQPSETRTSLSIARLDQNHPNPFSTATRIRYFIPETVKVAGLKITSVSGAVIKEMEINTRGEGVLKLDTQMLSAGQYYYLLVLDGQILASKKMVLTGR